MQFDRATAPVDRTNHQLTTARTVEDHLADELPKLFGGQPAVEVQEMLADMIVKTESARLLCWRAGWLKDNDLPSTKESSMMPPSGWPIT